MSEEEIRRHEYERCKLTRMTIMGAAGTGKSVLIKTLITTIRRMFNKNDVALVGAPTGCAGYNAGGETNHKLFAINSNSGEVTGKKQTRLLRRLCNALFVIIDERSMCDCFQLGVIENNCRKFAFKGLNQHLSFGGIPFVIIIGDDYQLPPVDPGAFYALQKEVPSKIKNKKNKNILPLYNNGRKMFRYLGKDTWKLDKKHRILQHDKKLEKILNGVRGETNSTLQDKDAEHLLQYHLRAFTPGQKTEIEKDALFLSATKNEVRKHNLKCLVSLSSRDNPIAKIHAKTTSHCKRTTTALHFDKDRNPEITRLTVGARVYLNGWNPAPSWGLYHGSIGIVKDIVFEENQNPNDKDLPLYVIVDFEHYKGPPFFHNNPTYVPIPRHTRQCDLSYGNTCCERTNIPLQLAFGKTIHTFQGQSVGKVQPHQPKNQFQRIIVDPGN